MNITIKTIPHTEQRYETCGDWYFDKEGNIEIRVSDMGDWKKEFLVAYHELLEVALCKDRGITIEQVDAFDMQFEKERLEGKHIPDEEPGYAEDAPYRNEHFMAEACERIAANQLNVNWKEYDETCMNL